MTREQLMKLSFTGTQLGLTPFQKKQLEDFLREARPSCLIHGGCIGADFQADEIASRLGIPRYVFRCDLIKKSVGEARYVEHNGSDVVFVNPDPLPPPLVRNARIVKAGNALVACPKEHTEVLRSGTWMTVRLARKHGLSVKIIKPW